MSWFKRPGERKPTGVSSSRGRSDTDPNTCLEVFQNHWKQACTVILLQDRKTITASGQATGDGVELVMHNMESMITLLVSEDDDGGMPGPILHYVMESELLETFCNWCSVNCPVHESLRIRQLRLFELVISQSHQMLLIHKPVIKPLLKLLMEVAESQEVNNGELEFKLVLVLHQICICISQQGLILESFFSTDTDHGPARFLIFSLLIPFIHREGPVGQKARDALLLIMTLSSRHPHIGHYIANNSHFCPVLATGLNGLYSSLPRRLPPTSEDWHRITHEDCLMIPDLQMFLNSLQFSNAVVQVAHPLVRDQLIHFIYTGFLLPVLAPALHQISREEVTTATAYLELLIRYVTDPHLLKTVLQFILTEKFDDALILDSLISRLSSNSLLSTVTLSLFNTLIDLNCEDVMFQLVFRYLVPCTHVMVSQRRSVRDLDVHGKSAEKFLSLRPSCCSGIPSSNSSNTILSTSNATTLLSMSNAQLPSGANRPSALSPDPSKVSSQQPKMETNYFEYLLEAKIKLGKVGKACKNWKHPYDGENPAPDSLSSAKDSGDGNQVGNEEGKKEMPGFLEVGSFSSNAIVADKKEDSSVYFQFPQTEKDKDVSDDAFVSPSKQKDLKLDDPRLFNSLKDLDSFLEYLYDCDVSLDDGDVSETTDVNNSLISLDNLINSLSMVKPEGLSIANGNSSVVDLNMTSLSPILASTTQFSFISHSELPDAPDVLESTAFTDISMSQVPKDIPVNIVDNSSFVNISRIPSTCDKTEDSGSAVVGDCKNLVTPRAERKVPTDFKKGFKFKSLLHTATSVMSPITPVCGDSMSAYRQLMSPMCEDLPALTPSSPKRNLKYTTDPPNIGPFLITVFSRLEAMMSNTLSFNLLLTGLLARLVCYPQPLLRSFFLNHNLVFQPSVKSLIQVLSLLKQKLESQSVRDKQFNKMVASARDNLVRNEDALSNKVEPDLHGISPSFAGGNPSPPHPPVKKRAETISAMSVKEKKKVTLTDLFFRRSGRDKVVRDRNSKSSQLQRVEVSGTPGYLFINNPHASTDGSAGSKPSSTNTTWNTAYCALVLDKFLKELAALSQEHSVLCLDEGYLSS